MKKRNLIKCFMEAQATDMQFVGIQLETPAGAETIILEKESFDKKCEFYTNAYTDDLVHCMNEKVKIIGFTFGISFEDIQEDLLGL